MSIPDSRNLKAFLQIRLGLELPWNGQSIVEVLVYAVRNVNLIHNFNHLNQGTDFSQQSYEHRA
jgi:hypothetical protein